MADQKILIVDDDAAVCKVISRVVLANGLSPYAAESGERALELIDREDFALVVLDLQLGGIDGFEVVERVRGRKKDVPIIILSANNEAHDKLYGLEIGADDYVTKPFDPIFLGAKIKALIRRDRRVHTASVLTSGDIEYHPGTMKLFIRGEDIPLSTKEHALLRLFLENKGRVFTKEQLYEHIWGETIVDENAIMVYVSRLRSKLEADPKNPVHILTVWGVGYKFAD
ncbi:MAG: response regulator transcription factor [Clostridiales bacterium]|jgi:DNA-binding response OmpR family regulator|nr:response regulator transcription factor [Clostridiales bacterium]